MKLLRYGPSGQEEPGLVDRAGELRELSGHLDDLTAAAIASGMLERIAELDAADLPRIDGSPRIGRRHGAGAAALTQAGRHDAARHREPGRAVAAGRGRRRGLTR